MSRISPLTRAELPPVLDDLAASIPDDELGHLRIFAHAPEAAHAWITFQRAMKKAARLPSDLIELVRLRVAFHNQCPHCMAIRLDDGVSEAMVCSLERPEEAPDLTELQRAALRYADAMATDHFAIDDAMFQQLRQHFDDGELVELGMWIATFVGFGRLGFGWRLTDDIPDRYGAAAPGQLHFSAEPA